MGWFSNLISGGATELVDSVGGVIDSLHTSGEEKAQAKLALVKEVNNLKVKVMEAQAQYDQEITKRWQSDNEHAITRLVRPISFSFVLCLFAVIALFDGNLGQFKVNPSYIPLIENLLITMVFAYFGSRGAEKITGKIQQKHLVQPKKTPLMQNFEDEIG